MLANRNIGRRLIVSAVALAAAVYAVFVASGLPAVAAWITNSDQLTIPAFVVDVSGHPANFFGWQLPRSSYLFPDTLSYALAYWTTHDALDSIVLAQLPVLIAWIYVVYRAAPRGTADAPWTRLAWAVGTGLLVPLLLTQLSSEMGAWVTKYVFSFANHFAAFVLGVLLLGWSLDELAARSPLRLAAIGLITALVAASNRAIWLFYLFPLAVVLAALLLRSPRRAWRSAARVAVVVLLGAAIGYVVEGSFNRITVMPYELTTGSLGERSRAFFATVASYGAAHPGMALGLVLLAAFYLAAARSVVRRAGAFWRGALARNEERDWLFDAALVAAALANVLAAMISWQNIGNARYLMLFFFAPPLLAGRLLPLRLHGRALVATALLLFAGSAVAALRADNPVRLATYARKETLPLASCLRTLHAGRGLANYWIARKMAFLSNGEIRIDQVSPGAGSKETLFFYWGNDAYAFLQGHPDVDPYDYVIADTLDPKVLTAAFGAPDAVTHCAHREIWTYEDKTRLFAGLFQGNLAPWQRVLARDWTVSIPAAAFRGAAGTNEGLARVADASDAGHTLIDGSRLALPAGPYRFAVAYSTPGTTAPATKVGTLRLMRAGGQAPAFVDLFAAQPARSAQARVYAEVSGPEDVVEPQVIVAGTALRVDTLTITRVEHADTEIRLQAGDAHLHTQVGVERDGVIASTGKAGVLLYGPYLPLSPGRYRASLYFATDRPSAANGRIDLAAEKGRRVLAGTPIDPSTMSAAGPGWRVDLDFDLDRRVADLELRVFVDERASVKVASYEVLPRAERPPVRSMDNPPLKSLP